MILAIEGSGQDKSEVMSRLGQRKPDHDNIENDCSVFT